MLKAIKIRNHMQHRTDSVTIMRFGIEIIIRLLLQEKSIFLKYLFFNIDIMYTSVRKHYRGEQLIYNFNLLEKKYEN